MKIKTHHQLLGAGASLMAPIVMDASSSLGSALVGMLVTCVAALVEHKRAEARERAERWNAASESRQARWTGEGS